MKRLAEFLCLLVVAAMAYASLALLINWMSAALINWMELRRCLFDILNCFRQGG